MPVAVTPLTTRLLPAAQQRIRRRVTARAETDKASSSTTTSTSSTATSASTPSAPEFDVESFTADLKSKWDSIDDKTSVAVYTVGAVTLVWLSSSLVGAINNVPLLPKMMELVGLGYTTWFVYRYLLFKESREELIADVDELKKKISGDK